MSGPKKVLLRQSYSQLSNPFSTGGGGHYFESHVQTAFAVLMLAGGFAPCLPPWSITKIKLQGRYAGYNTDDFVAFAKMPGAVRESKLLAQIKHSVAFTATGKTFGEVIACAWCDFNNRNLFDPETDAIALITGPLSASDSEDVRRVLEWARASSDAAEFVNKVELANFSSNGKRAKLKAFRTHLHKAKGVSASDDELWRFLKCFHVLGYDLDIRAGVTLSLLHSLIGQYRPENVREIWSQLVLEVQSANQNAGTLEVDKLPEDLRRAFERRPTQTIPEELIARPDTVYPPTSTLSQYASELTFALLLGKWNEAFDEDKSVVEAISGSTYAEWISKMRNVLLENPSPLKQHDGKWEVSDRLELWMNLGPRVFDEHLGRLREAAIGVLSEQDSRLELPVEERYAAAIHGKALAHSDSLRTGLSETLALLGSHPKALTSCSSGAAETAAVLDVREILSGADWVRWCSLNDLLPLLAEAAPNEFLTAVEKALDKDPCPFDIVFAQERSGIFGANYATGLLWALEGLAWDADYLTRVIVILGELAARDPGGTWANRPVNSLTTILLPWAPQTCASAEKRKAAVVTLLAEVPDQAWKLLLSLLPASYQVSSGSHRPAWRETGADESSKGVTQHEYWEQIGIYSDLILDIAKSDLAKLAELVDRWPYLPGRGQEELLGHLGSDAITSLPETTRLPLWMELVDLVVKHTKYSDADWALKPEQLSRIAAVTERLAPEAPALRYRRLFSERDFDLYDEKGTYTDQQKKLENRRQRAVEEVAATAGAQSVVAFAASVESPWCVGIAYGLGAGSDVDRVILPDLLDGKESSLAQFAGGYIVGRFRSYSWSWVDGIDTARWGPAQVGAFLSYLPFTPDTWKRSARLLGRDESPYWTKTGANPYETITGLEVAVDKLVEHGRPLAAVRCLHRMLHERGPFDSVRSVRALLAALGSSEPSPALTEYEIVEVIKAMQDDPLTDPNDLFKVEWAYLPFLDEHREAAPKLLHRRLANEPEFFCEVIRLAFRSKKAVRSAEGQTEEARNRAANSYRLLSEWRIPPGSQEDGSYDGDFLARWLDSVKAECTSTGHLEVAMTMVGCVLTHAPADPDGLWIHRSVAAALNTKDADIMRKGFGTQLINSRGVHGFSAGKEEREFAAKYRSQADVVEDSGFHRLASTLREVAGFYEREADREASRDPYED